MSTESDADGVEARIKALASARDAAKVEAAELRAAKAALEAELAPLRETAVKYETEAKAWASERTFLEVGISDPEARDIARILHERIPEAERPALDVWLRAAKQDPTTAPKALQPYLAAPPAAVAAVAAPPTQRPPPATARAETAPSAGVAVSAEAIRASYRQALATGDWTAYDGLKAQVLSPRP